MKIKFINSLLELPFLWLCTGLLILPNGDKNLVAIIGIAILAQIYKTKGIKLYYKSPITKLTCITSLFLVFIYFKNGISSSEFRTFIALSLYFLFIPHSIITKNKLVLMCFFSSLVCLSFVYYNQEIISLSRSHWPINAIPYSTMVAVYSLIATCTLLEKNSKLVTITLIFSLILNCLTIVLSETRGIWLSFITSIIFISSYKLIFDYKKIYWKYILLFMGLVVLVLFLGRHNLNQRITETQNEYAKIAKGNLNTSIGLRLQMWSIAPTLIKENPYIGLGEKHLASIKRLYAEKKISKSLYRFNPPHYHNQFIDTLVKKGFIGFTLLILMLALPIFLIHKYQPPQLYKLIAYSTIILFTIASLTDVPFRHSQTLFLYSFFVLYTCIWAKTASLENKNETNSSY